MIKFNVLIFWVIPLGLSEINFSKTTNWGFYAHKLINRMAVFTLPEELIEFYKDNIEYISSHAVDPDKRRYAVKGEAIRHYIDLDHWTSDTTINRSNTYAEAIVRHSSFYLIKGNVKLLLFDTISSLFSDSLYFTDTFNELKISDVQAVSIKDLSRLVSGFLMEFWDPDGWVFTASKMDEYLTLSDENEIIEIQDGFSNHGILPYHLEKSYFQLIEAFKTRNIDRILRWSADIGHYIGDAHVPLHTTQNYNGQLTNQNGIHAFWESRIPELFAESEFDFVVGRARYISNIKPFIWDIIKDSHAGVSKVFQIEKAVSLIVPPDQQYCFDERMGQINKIQCRDYAGLYHKELDYQVEDRMRMCILNLGSIWLSAWIEAGQPELNDQKPDDEFNFSDTIPQGRLPYQLREHE